MFSIDPSRMPGLACVYRATNIEMDSNLCKSTSHILSVFSKSMNGASGAVNAIMLRDIFLSPKATFYFDFIIPVPAIALGDGEISGSARLGGAAVAAITWA